VCKNLSGSCQVCPGKTAQCLFQPASLQVQPHLTKRAPDAGDSAAFSSIFLRLSIFPVGRRSAARPSAGNANRWATQVQNQIHLGFTSFVLWLSSEIQVQFFSSGIFQVGVLGFGFQPASFQVLDFFFRRCFFR